MTCCFSVKDDMIKRVADARMHPWEMGKAVQEAESASAQTRRGIKLTLNKPRLSGVHFPLQFRNIICSTQGYCSFSWTAKRLASWERCTG